MCRIRPSACRCFPKRCKPLTQPQLLQRYSFKLDNLRLAIDLATLGCATEL